MHQPYKPAASKPLVSSHLDDIAFWLTRLSGTAEKDRKCTLEVWLLLLFFALAFAASAAGQTPFTRIYGPEDQDVPLPQFVPLTGNKDATALQTIQGFLTAVTATPWLGIQATGTFTIAGSQQAAPEAATLTISGGDDYRLDLITPNGTRSIRIHGPYEEVQEPDGTKHSAPFLAAQAGLVAFPKLLSSAFLTSNVTVLDGGTVTIAGQSLHRITVEQSLYFSASHPTANNTSVTDFYFNPTTNLLVKSAVAVPISWSDRELYLEVTTYANYQTSNGVVIPLTSSQTINGQPEWTLHLTSVQPLPSLPNSYFHF